MTHLLKRFRGSLSARRERKRKMKEERQAQFRKGFVHKSSEPKHFEIKPEFERRKRFSFRRKKQPCM
jgi:hypothetical protein